MPIRPRWDVAFLDDAKWRLRRLRRNRYKLPSRVRHNPLLAAPYAALNARLADVACPDVVWAPFRRRRRRRFRPDLIRWYRRRLLTVSHLALSLPITASPLCSSPTWPWLQPCSRRR